MEGRITLSTFTLLCAGNIFVSSILVVILMTRVPVSLIPAIVLLLCVVWAFKRIELRFDEEYLKCLFCTFVLVCVFYGYYARDHHPLNRYDVITTVNRDNVIRSRVIYPIALGTHEQQRHNGRHTANNRVYSDGKFYSKAMAINFSDQRKFVKVKGTDVKSTYAVFEMATVTFQLFTYLSSLLVPLCVVIFWFFKNKLPLFTFPTRLKKGIGSTLVLSALIGAVPLFVNR